MAIKTEIVKQKGQQKKARKADSKEKYSYVGNKSL